MAKFCNICGTTIKDGEDKCYFCGTKIETEKKVHVEKRSENENHGKSRIVAGLLAIFLGIFGAHDFYIGKVFTGTFKAFLALILPVWGLVILFVLGIIDGIGILSGRININNPFSIMF